MNVKQKKEYFKLNNHNKKVSIDNKGSLGYALSTAESLDLTGEDLVRICEGKVRVVSYHELKDYKNIEDYYNLTVLLYYYMKQIKIMDIILLYFMIVIIN